MRIELRDTCSYWVALLSLNKLPQIFSAVLSRSYPRSPESDNFSLLERDEGDKGVRAVNKPVIPCEGAEWYYCVGRADDVSYSAW